MDWNPDVPDLAGLQAVGRTTGHSVATEDYGPLLQIASPAHAAVMRLDSTVTETVNLAAVPLVPAASSGNVALIETLLASTAEQSAYSTAVYRPNGAAKVGSEGTWQTQAGSTTSANLAGAVDDASASESSYIKFVPTVVTPNNFSDQIFFEFPTAGLHTGDRIIDVRLVVVCALVSTGAAQLDPYGYFGAGGFALPPAQPPPNGSALNPVTLRYSTGEIHKATGDLWTIANVQAMDTPGSTSVLGFQHRTGVGVELRVYQVWCEVDYITENRVAAQIALITGGTAARWHQYTPRTPTAGTNIAKVNSTDLVTVVRQPRTGSPGQFSWYSTLGQVGVPLLSLASDPPPPGLISYPDVQMAANGLVSALGDPGRTPFGWMMSVAGTRSVDTQPFSHIATVPVTGVVQQEITGANGSYGAVSFPIAPDGTSPGTLTVQVKRRSDNVVMGAAVLAPAVFAQAVFDPNQPVGSPWKYVTLEFTTPATLSSGTQYYVDFTVTDAVGDDVWLLQSFTGRLNGDTTTITGLGSFNGTSDIATIAGTDRAQDDLAVVLVIQPGVISGLDADPLIDPLLTIEQDYDGCTADGLPGIRLTWNESTGTFGFYEIQRFSTPLGMWQVIARITDIDVVTFDDYECPIGELSSYRVFRTNAIGAYSSEGVTVSATCPTAGVRLTFTSNEDPELGVVASDVYGDRVVQNIQWPGEADVVERQFYMRDDRVMVRPLEDGGIRLPLRLLISRLASVIDGPAQFDMIRAIATAPLSYVCVRDSAGNVWFMHVAVPTGDIRKPGQQRTSDVYTVDVVCTQVTRTPSIVDRAQG